MSHTMPLRWYENGKIHHLKAFTCVIYSDVPMQLGEPRDQPH